MDNPLLKASTLPAFSHIKPEHIEPAIDTLLAENRAWLKERLTQDVDASWDNLIAPMNERENRLEKAWSPVSHMNAVVNTDALRDAYNTCLPKLSEYHTEMGQNKALFEAIQFIREHEAGLSDTQKKSLDDSLLGFRLSGVDLPDVQKARFSAISQSLSKLSSQFSDNVLDANNHWFHQISNEDELAGLPESARAMAMQAAQQRDKEGWVFTLDFPSYIAVLTYADNRELRKTLYRAYSTRASELGEKAEWDNTTVIQDILRLRQERAELLGYRHHTDVSLATKMAEDSDEVVHFLEDLATRSKAFADQEYAEVCAFAVDKLGIASVEAWDVAYISEKMKQQRFDFTEEDLKPYFPVDKVVDGLFSLVQRLYGVRIEAVRDGIDTWHPDVRFYRILDADNQLKAEFYLDLYARQHKRGGAWMSDYCGRFKRAAGMQTPVAFMTCNSAPPVGDTPALFTHDEVVTLFHEFGHGLHHMMTQIDYPDVAGINGVEWDAVELPSQFMENWCYEREVLDQISGHWQSGESLPDDLFAKMNAARHFQSAMAMVRQLEFALFDIRLHLDARASEAGRMASIHQQVRDQVAVVKPPAFNRMAHSFSHIFAGGYAAGYYSYKWAEVLSADAYARFEEEGLFNEEVGQAFLQEVLEVGGSRPAMASFVAFRGRKPEIDALLRHSGLIDAATAQAA